MKIHHLDCTTMCPPSARLVNGSGSLIAAGRMVCHCLLIELPTGGLALVDTGLSARWGGPDKARDLGRGFLLFARPRFDPEVTALGHVRRLGFSASDVRHILLTHLDVDHAGGLVDFPEAKVHVMAREHAAAMVPDTHLARERYRAVQWAHGPRWALHEPAGEPWLGFECVRQLEGLPPELLMVPLTGHTWGHAGIAVDTGKGWLLHAGDAYFFQAKIDSQVDVVPQGLALYERLAETSGEARRGNLSRLRALVDGHRGDVRVFCAHDAADFDRLTS